jgi:hypothetical protein
MFIKIIKLFNLSINNFNIKNNINKNLLKKSYLKRENFNKNKVFLKIVAKILILYLKSFFLKHLIKLNNKEINFQICS